MNEFECTYTEEVVCPYCGYRYKDSWEISGDSGIERCRKCDKPFAYGRAVTVDYSTDKLIGKCKARWREMASSPLGGYYSMSCDYRFVSKESLEKLNGKCNICEREIEVQE